MSKIFKCILRNVCSKKINEPFRVIDVRECLDSSRFFLWKHALNNPNRVGRPYFIRIERGLFIINPDFKTCL